MTFFAMLAATALLAAPPPVTGDFDHDGRVDTAGLVDGGSGHRTLVVLLAARPDRPLKISDFTDASPIFLAKAPSGRSRTACGKGAGPATAQCVPHVDVSGDVLAFGTPEASEAYAIWNGASFDTVWMSD